MVTAPVQPDGKQGTSKSFALGSFTDPGADSPWQVTVAWGDGTSHTVFNATSAGSLPSKSHTYATHGSFTVTITVNDGVVSDHASFHVTVANVAPVVSAPAAQTASEGTSKSFALGSFTDPGADSPWQVTVAWGDGTSHTVFNAASAGSLPPKSHTYATDGLFTVTVTVNDGVSSDHAAFRVTVTAPGGGNHPPSFSSTPPLTATVGAPYNYLVTAADLDAGDSLTLTAPTRPGWLTLTPAANGAATLAGTPAPADVGANPVLLRVVDAAGATATQSFTITVAAAPVASGSITGTVVDENGAGVSHAQVTLTDQPTALTAALLRTTQTDATGVYRFDDVPAAAYTLTVALAGFVAPAPTSVTVTAGHTAAAAPLVLTASPAQTYLPFVIAGDEPTAGPEGSQPRKAGRSGSSCPPSCADAGRLIGEPHPPCKGQPSLLKVSKRRAHRVRRLLGAKPGAADKIRRITGQSGVDEERHATSCRNGREWPWPCPGQRLSYNPWPA